MRAELERVAARVEEAAARLGIREWEAFAVVESHAGVDVAGGRLNLAAAARETGVGLRVLGNGRAGFTYCPPDEVERGLRRARAGCAVGPQVMGGFPSPTPAGTDEYHNGLAGMGPEDVVDAAARLLEGGRSAGDVQPTRGRVGTDTRHCLVANSSGVRAYSRGTSLGGYLTCTARRDDDVVTGFEEFLSRRPDVDFQAAGRDAGEKALSLLGGRAAPAGALRVILRPLALFDLLQGTLVPGLFGGTLARGESFYSGKVGKRVAGNGLTVADDPTLALGPSSFAFDEEGAGSRRVPLIEDGVLVDALYDHFSAAEHGAAPTASGMRYVRLDASTSHRRPPTTGGRNLVLEGDTVPYEELVTGTRRGIIVDYVLGAHTANRASGDFSVAVYSGYYVQDGEAVHPLKGGMISGNVAEMLNDFALADDRRAVAGGHGGGACLPSAAVEGLRYSAQ